LRIAWIIHKFQLVNLGLAGYFMQSGEQKIRLLLVEDERKLARAGAAIDAPGIMRLSWPSMALKRATKRKPASLR
jgi:hypothetical protein